MRSPLEEVVATLPKLPQPLTEASPDISFSSVATCVPGYVWPDLRTNEPTLQPTSHVFLISAPGAMGKSAAARAIASALNAPLVDLGRLRVGSNGLTGLLTRVLGWGQVAAFVQRLQAGEAAIVLDGIDEAQLASGRDNYQAFLGDIKNLMAGAVQAGQIVMLGRPDSAETTYLGFAEIDVTPQQVEVAPLSRQQSCQLIDLRLDQRSIGGRAYSVHRTHPVPFGELREATFAGIAHALTPEGSLGTADPWSSNEGFLGYPPVLMALAERLAVDNPMAELSAGTESDPVGRADPGQLLQRIVEAILDRESGKVRGQLADPLSLAAQDPRRQVLYGRDEQVLRLLTFLGATDVPVEAPAVLDDQERASYEELISSFVPDHPLLAGQTFANAVFRDYARAFALTSPLLGAQGSRLGEVIRALPDVGPFFAAFVHSLSGHAVAPVPESLVGDLVRSNAAGSVDGGQALYSHRGSAAILQLYAREADFRSDAEEGALLFRVPEPSGVLELHGPLARQMVLSDYGVVLHSLNGLLTLGPNLVIVARDIEISAAAVEGLAGEESLGAVLVAQAVNHDGRVRVGAQPRGLRVSWPDMWQQWKPFSIDLSGGGLGQLDALTSAQVFLGLRRILLSFHSSVRADPSVYSEKFERFTLGGNDVFVATFAALQDLAIVERDGDLYRLRLENLARFGISYVSLSGGDLEANLSTLHSEVSKHAQVQALTNES